MQKRNSYVDFFKGISCIAVILIHCRFPGAVGGVFRAIARFAVPYFFSATGYYLYNTANDVNIQKLKHRLRKTIMLLLYAELFYVVFYIASNFLIFGLPFETILENFTMAGIVRLIVDNSPVLYPHLWYVFALIYCYVFIIYVFSAKIKNECKIVYCFITLTYYVIFSEILPRFGIEDVFTPWHISIHNTFLIRALPFVFLGAIVRDSEERIKNISLLPIHVYLGTFLLCLISVAERVLFSDSGVYLSSIGLIILFWIISINKICPVNTVFVHIGNQLSTYIYIIHIAVMNLFDMICLKININENIFVMWVRPIVVILISLGVSEIIAFYKQEHKQKRGL